MIPSLLVLTALVLQQAAPATEPATGPAPTAEASPPATERLREAVAAVDVQQLPGLTLTGYEVRGRSARGVRESMNDERPAAEGDDARHDARTRWSYRPRWNRTADGQCDAASATVTLSLTIVLPDLATREALSRDERAGWDAYFAALVKHEWNHGRIAEKGQELMETALRGAPNCEAMTAVVRTYVAEITAASREYDAQTEHGRKEGAVFPRGGASR